jgi:hypothetical protein
MQPGGAIPAPFDIAFVKDNNLDAFFRRLYRRKTPR